MNETNFLTLASLDAYVMVDTVGELIERLTRYPVETRLGIRKTYPDTIGLSYHKEDKVMELW